MEMITNTEHKHDFAEIHREEGSEVITIYYECRICYKTKAKDYVYQGD